LPLLPAFQILIIFGVSKGIVTVCPPVFFIAGKPWLITLSAAVMALLFGGMCIPMTVAYGINGTAWSVVMAAVSAHAISIVLAVYLLTSRKYAAMDGFKGQVSSAQMID
jgi:O-antigen/teichoic acid export membrane protein